MKANDRLQVMDGFRTHLLFDYDGEWNYFKPIYVNPSGNSKGISIQIIEKRGDQTIIDPKLLFSVEKFMEIRQRELGIVKDPFSSIELALCKVNEKNEIVTLTPQEIGNFRIEIGYELHLN